MLLVVIYDSYLPSVVELKFVSVTISAAGGGTYNLSVEITHGTGKGSYFILGEDQLQCRDVKNLWDYIYEPARRRGVHRITWGKSWSPSRPRPWYPTHPSKVQWNVGVLRSFRICCMWSPLVQECTWSPCGMSMTSPRPRPENYFVIPRLLFLGHQEERSTSCRWNGLWKRGRTKAPIKTFIVTPP